MSKEDINNLNVELIADENCILFLWATFPNLPQAINVIKAWGFKYKTVGFVWVKMKNDMSEPRGDGMGFYTLSNAEIILIGVKGKFKRNKKNVKQIILHPKSVHSVKPGIVRDKIIDLCGDIPRIELFAREKTKGWDVWGNEVKNDIELI